MKELAIYDPWCAAYAITMGVTLIRVTVDTWPVYVMDDSEGAASRTLGQWGSNKAITDVRKYAKAYKHIKRLQMTQKEISCHGTPN